MAQTNIKDFKLMDSGKNLFDQESGRYIVPLYQRAFAWGTETHCNRENEIIQLIDDISDVKCGDEYYLGTLIVFRRPGQDFYEVIDGQQRLTALYLLFECLGSKINNKSALTYDCRPKADYTLSKIEELMKDNVMLDAAYDKGIYMGIKTIQRKIQSDDPSYIARLNAALERVHLFRIEVPECTDLNRYFEIMNTRGEQLEQHDIVKASLMSFLSSEECEIFSEIWNACSDMNGYVQMHFSPNRRYNLFGGGWSSNPTEEQLHPDNLQKNMNAEKIKIQDVIKQDFEIENIDGFSDNDERIRFESIIDFQHFLLHTLKVFVASEEIACSIPEEKLTDDLLDDKKIILSFERVQKYGVVNGQKLTNHDFAWKFIVCLLRCRFLFDKYIIKREFREENSVGKWSLQEMHVSDSRPYYSQTEFKEYREWAASAEYRKKYNRMIQACLRVSYTSPKNMHWITELLLWVYTNYRNNFLNQPSQFDQYAQKIAASAAAAFVFGVGYQQGVNTPHIVFNFLDFLLWKQSYDSGHEIKFDFEFRNSVEHWYPQHPTENQDGCPPWNTEDGHGTVDRFGNLALLPVNINSRFSSQSPLGKKGYESVICNGSLKLRIMAEKTTTSDLWRTTDCEQHEKEMLDILKSACLEFKTPLQTNCNS